MGGLDKKAGAASIEDFDTELGAYYIQNQDSVVQVAKYRINGQGEVATLKITAIPSAAPTDVVMTIDANGNTAKSVVTAQTLADFSTGSTNAYIQNQNTVAQTAVFWNATPSQVGGATYLGTYKFSAIGDATTTDAFLAQGGSSSTGNTASFKNLAGSETFKIQNDGISTFTPVVGDRNIVEFKNAAGTQSYNFRSYILGGGNPDKIGLYIPNWLSTSPISIGSQAPSGAAKVISIGGGWSGPTFADDSIKIGYAVNLTMGLRSVAVGHYSQASGVNSINISSNVGTYGDIRHDNCFVIGGSATPFHSSANNQGILSANDIYISNPATNNSSDQSNVYNGINTSLNGSGSVRTSNGTGGNLSINAGVGQGIGVGGDLIFKTPAEAAPGTTIQTLTERVRLKYDTGNLLIGTATDSGTAKLQIAAGTTTVAPLQLTSGTNLTTAVAGSVEFDGTNYFVTKGTTRYTLAKTLTNTATLNFGSILAGASETLTINVPGAVDGNTVVLGIPNGTMSIAGVVVDQGWVSAADTVSIRIHNRNAVTAVDPPSGTFRATVLQYS